MRARQKIKLRKSTRCFFIIIVTALLVIVFSNFIQNILKNDIIKSKDEIYNYTNKYSYNYNVNLVPNKYIESETLPMDETYITDLINNVNFCFNYSYIADKKTSIEYSYKIIGRLQAVYTKDGVEQKVWDKEEVLKESSLFKTTTDKIEFQEPIEFDLQEKNKLVTDFEQEMNMTLDTTYTLIFEVEAKTEIDGQTVDNKYSSSVLMDLGEKTTEINGENNKEETSYLTKDKEEIQEVNLYELGISVVLIGLLLSILYYIHKNTVIINKIKNDYRGELNKMLRLCQDKIVKISDKVDIKQDTVVDVKDFVEIIKVSDELFKPILYWVSKDKDEAWFSVISGDITYRYVFKNNS